MKHFLAVWFAVTSPAWAMLPAWAQAANPPGDRIQSDREFLHFGRHDPAGCRRARQIFGVLVGPGIDAHDFQPAPKDAQSIKNADLIIANGLGFEPRSDRLTEGSAVQGTDSDRQRWNFRAKPVRFSASHFQNFSCLAIRAWGRSMFATLPRRWRATIRIIVMPYRANAQRYIAELEALDQSTRERMAQIDPSSAQGADQSFSLWLLRCCLWHRVYWS